MRRSANLFAGLVVGIALVATIATCRPAAAAWVYVGAGSQILRVDSHSGAILATFKVASDPDDEITSLIFDRNGDLLVADGGDDDGSVPTPGQILRVDPLSGAVKSVFIPAGSGGLKFPINIAIGPDNNVYVLDFPADNQWVVRKYDGGSGAPLGNFATLAVGFVGGMVFGPDGNLYLSDLDQGGVRRLNGQTGAPAGFLVPAGQARDAYALTFGPDGNLYVSTYAPPAELQVFNGTTGALLRTINAPGLARADSLLSLPDGSFVLTTPDVPPGGVQGLSPTGAVSQLLSQNTLLVGHGLAAACNPGVNQICMEDSRFRATVDWLTAQGEAGEGRPIRYSDDTSEFWFFGPDNLEMVVKVIDGCALNQHYWVFAGGLTNVALTLTLTDTHTGAVKTYRNPQNTPFKPQQDTTAFATCP